MYLIMYFAHRFNALHKYPLLFKNISTVSDIKKRIKKKNKKRMLVNSWKLIFVSFNICFSQSNLLFSTLYLASFYFGKFFSFLWLTSLSRLNLLKSSSLSNLVFWSGTTRGILKTSRGGRGCSYRPIPSKGSTPTPACSLIACIILVVAS